ncbi:MAG TPA: hypothetical protein VHX38_19715 [Pseudonocardiaceae bacterium]|nr:hypothetical protein [Pseudonocardiaceae bacterium]
MPGVPVAAGSFFAAALVTAIIGTRQITGGNPRDRIWLVLLVLLGLIALGLLGWARDTGRRLRLGIGWAVLGAGTAGSALRFSPGSVPGVPLDAGWALLVVAGVGALVGGVLLAVAPWSRPTVRGGLLPLVVLAVCAVQVAGYWVAVSWTNGQNVRLSVADPDPLHPRTAVLDGRTLWSSATTGPVVGSAGGLLSTVANGVRMVDPSTGRVRWSYRRADVTGVVDPVASADGRLVAVEAGRTDPTESTQDATALEGRRLLVFDADTGAVLDNPLATNVQGTLASVADGVAYFAGGPSDTDVVQLTAVDTTGPLAGRVRWVFYPKDRCQINRFSAAGGALVLSTSCGSVTMLRPDGKPRWTYRTPAGGAEVWPLVGAPAGMVLVSDQAPVGPADPGFGAPIPKGVMALDASTGRVRWQDRWLPAPPFTATSQDLADGSVTAVWAKGTAVLAYYLPVSRQVWLLGVDPADGSTWTADLPDMNFLIQGAQTIGDYLAVLPDGRILLPDQRATVDVGRPPSLTVVNGRTGAKEAPVPVGNLDRPTGYRSTAAVDTPAGVVLDISKVTGPPSSLLVGLH